MKINSSVAANSYLLDAVTNNIDQGISVRSSSLHSVRSIIMRLMMVMMIVGGWNVVRADSYTITFITGSGDGSAVSTSTSCSDIVNAGGSYISGNVGTATNAYHSGSGGLKLGKSSSPTSGTIKMNLSASGQVNATSIIVNAKLYNSSKAATLSVNGAAAQSVTADFSDLTFNITGSITYLELVSSKYIWISSITVNYTVAPSFTIISQSNDLTLGTVSLSGSTITASPNDCAQYASPAYTVTSGTATVLQSGNTFNVTPTSNCTVRINFEAIPTYMVSFSTGSTGIVAPSPITETACGAGVTLPSATAPTGCDPEYTFYGWSTSIVNETTTAPIIVGTAGQTYHPSENITLYAVYKQTTGDNVEKIYGWETADDGTFWSISNMNNNNSAITAHSGSKYGVTNGTETAYIKTANKISHPVSIECYYSKTSNNTNSNSKFSIKVSSDGSSWTNVQDGKTFNQVTQGTWYCLSADLSSYENYYIEVYYSGTTAVRALDDVRLVYGNCVNTYNTNPSCVPCEADPAISATALNFSDITASSVTVEAPGGITSFGENCHIRSYGFVYGTSANPTLASGTVAEAGTSYTTINSSFNKIIDGLSPCTTYHVRAYATNGHGTVYGSDCTFTTGSEAEITGLISVNGETSATLYWNLIGEPCVSGNYHYVVICRQGISDIASSCSNYDFTSITANAAFGSGTQTSTGEYAVYSGSETLAAITNLTSGSTYTAAVFYVDDSGNCLLREQITFEYISITLLEPGDLAIVAVNNKRISTSGNTADEFSFMVFKNITAETSIDMTDNGYERNYAGYWGTEEGFWRITRKNRSLAAGSVVTISETVGRIGYNVEPALGTNINIYANGSLDNANWTIEVNGPLDLNREDQIWMMQGGSWNVLADNKADYTGNVLYGFTATGWETNVGFDDTHGSRIYPSSGCFVTTIEVGEGIVKYTGPLDHATKGEWITRINNEDNWTDYTTSNYPNEARNYCNASRPDATNYPSVNYPLTIDPGDFTKGKWNGKESDDWCDCRNWVSLVVPDENFDVEIPDVGNRNRVSLHEGVTAKCKTLTVKNGGFFNNTQANSVLKVVEDITIDAGGSFRPSENNAFEIIVGGNILNSGVFITNENTSLTLNGESSQSISAPSSGGNFKLRNLTIASPSNGFDADTIELYGNLRDNSASNLGFNLPQALTFRGSRSQTSTRTTITDITMNKSSNNLTLSGMLTVDGKAKFVKGNIIGNVTFLASATSSNASTNSYVDGTVTKKANASAFTFPTGSNGVLGTLEVSSLDADADLKFNHDPDGFNASEMPVWWNQNNMCGPNEGNAKFDHVTNMYFWNLGTSATIADAVFSVSADDDVHFNSETIEHDNADIDMAIYDGCWKNLGGTAATSDPYHLISVSDVDLPATRAGGDKVVTFGSIDHNTLLPIELTAFSAECNGSYAKILWTTATERNNDYFVLERSDDAISFDEIARLAGAGSSINPIDYTYIDNNVHGGDIFYRLVQVDYDGTRSVSEIIAVNCAIDADGEPEMAVYPNPFANDLTIHFENFGDRVALVEVYDMLGRMLVSRKVACSQNDYEFVLPLGGLPDGAYNVRVSAEDVVINRQVVKNR